LIGEAIITGISSFLGVKVTDPALVGLGRRARGVGKARKPIEACWIISWSGDRGRKITYNYLYAGFLKDEGNRFFRLRGFLVKKGKR